MIRHRILCVDDEDAILKSLNRLLSKEPYLVDLASSAREAMDLMDRQAYAVLLTDQRMPGMSGMELIQNIKVSSPATVRIMLSGQADIQEVMEALETNDISLFLKKPWDRDQLRRVLLDGVEHYENERRMFTLLEHMDLGTARKFMETSWLVEDRSSFEALSQITWSMSQNPLPIIIIDEEFQAYFLNQAVRILFPRLMDLQEVTSLQTFLLEELAEQLEEFFQSEETEAEISVFSGDVLVQRIEHFDQRRLYALYYMAKMPTESTLEEKHGSQE